MLYKANWLVLMFEMKSLDKNYRSCPQIVNFNNRVFSLDNLQAFLERRLEDATRA